MALTEGDKAICAEMTRQIVDEVVKEVMRVHMESCPHGRLIARSKVFFIGAFLGSGLASSGIVLTVLKVLGAV
jgi:hypothetical protein